jgi:hypothetical protein
MAASQLAQPPLLRSNKVDRIALYATEYPFDGNALRPLGVMIEDDELLETAIAALIRGDSIDEDDIPFVGILCYQVFLDSYSNIVAVTHVVNHDATVVFDSASLHGGKIWLSDRTGQKSRALRSVPFAQVIFDALQRDLPAYIQGQDKKYRRAAGKSLADLLGVTNAREERMDKTSQ